MNSTYERYRQTSIQTAPPEQLVVMLYDGVLRFLEQGRVALREGRDASAAIGRAQDILVELNASLDRSAGEVAENLARLYDFWIQRLFQALIQREPERLEETVVMVRELREAWAQIAVQKRTGSTAAAVGGPLNARG